MSNGKYWGKAWSLVDGCTRVSPGCDHCWLKDMDKRFRPKNLQRVKPDWTALNQTWVPNHPRKRQKPTRYSVWSDLFHESVPHDFQIKALMQMDIAKQHTFLILTKRPQIMSKVVRLYTESWGPLANVWFGTTVESSEQLHRVLHLVDIDGNLFLSLEPMIGPIDLRNINPLPDLSHDDVLISFDCLTGLMQGPDDILNKISWVILGGETGHGARPCHPEWVRFVRNQCQAAGVPFWFKGWGNNVPISTVNGFQVHLIGVYDKKSGYGYLRTRETKQRVGRLLDGREWNETPW